MRFHFKRKTNWIKTRREERKQNPVFFRCSLEIRLCTKICKQYWNVVFSHFDRKCCFLACCRSFGLFVSTSFNLDACVCAFRSHSILDSMKTDTDNAHLELNVSKLKRRITPLTRFDVKSCDLFRLVSCTWTLTLNTNLIEHTHPLEREYFRAHSEKLYTPVQDILFFESFNFMWNEKIFQLKRQEWRESICRNTTA